METICPMPGAEKSAPADGDMEAGSGLYAALLIRRLEQKLLDLFSEGKLNGTVHTCIGQEWSAVAVISALREEDAVFSNHRGHGHFLARTGDVAGLVAEVMGKASGVCGGVGGSQHLHAANYYSNGIQGGMAPVAAGWAFGRNLALSDGIATLFVGDGTLGEGVLYETLNMASRWELPLLIVLENNGYAQSTPARLTTAGTAKARAAAFDVAYRRADTWNWKGLLAEAEEAVAFVRNSRRPLLFEIETYRLKAHSKGDDNRAESEIRSYEKLDYLTRIIEEGSPGVTALLGEIDGRIEAAVREAERARPCGFRPAAAARAHEVQWTEQSFSSERIAHVLYQTFKGLLATYPEAVLIGEDVEGPYGGAFKITRDLSARFPGRVRNTPISEAAITGVGTGLALAGYRPVVEIMFGDFLTLTLDQLLQHATKFCEMYGRWLDVPLIVRTPMGGRRGYGPTHSQSIEKHFLGIPNLDVLALNARVSPALVYERLFDVIRNPTLVLEDKILYTRFLRADGPLGFRVLYSDEVFPTVRVTPIGVRPEVTVVCYGGMLMEAEQALERAFDEEDVTCEIICPSLIYPLNLTPIAWSVAATGRLVTVEEGGGVAGLGSEVVARLSEAGAGLQAVRRVSYDGLIPSSYACEAELLPSAARIVAAIKEVVR